MKIVLDPDVYGRSAKQGVFIPLAELKAIGGLPALEKAAAQAQRVADKKVEYYTDLQDCGLANASQQNGLLRWEEKADSICHIAMDIQMIKSRLK